MALVAAACGGGGATTTAEPPDRGPSTDAPPAETTAPAPETVAASGAMVRLVNLWANSEGPGPDVIVHVFGETDGEPLLEAAPGEVTNYVDVPATRIFENPERLEVRADMPGSESVDFSPDEGDELTIFAYGSGADGLSLGAFRHDIDRWPDMPSDKVSLLVYPGALSWLPDEINGVALSTTDGECLLDDSGEPERLGWGGNIPHYYQLEPGATELAVAHFPGPDCQVEPEVGTVTIEGDGGDRLALVPWGTGEGEIELFLLEMGAQP